MSAAHSRSRGAFISFQSGNASFAWLGALNNDNYMCRSERSNSVRVFRTWIVSRNQLRLPDTVTFAYRAENHRDT
jgi:hypothetical protein